MVVQINLCDRQSSGGAKLQYAIVVQNDVGNVYSPTTIVIPLIPSADIKKRSPLHVHLSRGEGGLQEEYVAACDQIRTVLQDRVYQCCGKLSRQTMAEIDHGLKISLELQSFDVNPFGV